MSPVPPAHPQRFHPDLEVIEKDEYATQEALTQTMLSVAEKTYADSGHATRTVHSKSHGLLKAELEVLDNLPPVLAQGLFARPATYPVVIRFSTIPGDILDDSVSTPRGVSIKVIGVEGERLPGAEEGRTQDFIFVNDKMFNSPNAKVFLTNLKLLAATTDKGEGLKKLFSAAMRTVEGAVQALGADNPTLKTLGGEPATNILGESFYSQLALRYGDYIAKFALLPVSPELKALTDAPIDLSDPNALRSAVVEFFRAHGGTWELCVQLCTDIDDMPIEDATKDWDEAESPFVPVARLTAQPQVAWSEARALAVDDGMGFSPWQGLAAHQPLGNLMRMRKLAYARAHAFRSERNRQPVVEPATLDAVPDA